MPLPDIVLLDTSAIYALFVSSDDFHERARDAFERLADREPDLLATSYTLVETIALVHRRLGFQVTSEIADWLDSTLEVYWVSPAVHKEAWTRFAAGQGRGLSFVDWATVVASRHLSARVFTFDPGFASQGLSVIPRPPVSRTPSN